MLVLGGVLIAAQPAMSKGDQFTIAVIPDTQGYMDYTHQKAEGFPIDASEQFLEQMDYISRNVESEDGEIAFVTSLGDVWQHQTLLIDPAHEKRGLRRVPNPLLDAHFGPTEKTRTIEMPMAHRGFDLIAGKVPFSVVPGNHDYDAMWTDSKHPPSANPSPTDLSTIGMLHPGGLNNFVSVFGNKSKFFKRKRWYVDSHNGGANSAQVFTAGGYRFLHIGLQFEPPGDALKWADEVIKRHPGMPTIVSTHSFLNTDGNRLSNPVIDSAKADPEDNSPQMIWDKFIKKNDQIFMVLCGHNHGQAFRVDANDFGHNVYQILSDYQVRKQTAIEAGSKLMPHDGIGDGWLRLMEFDMESAAPVVKIGTYSTHYKQWSSGQPAYASWYKAQEQPRMTDTQFEESDNFSFSMDDFRKRFGNQKMKYKK